MYSVSAIYPCSKGMVLEIASFTLEDAGLPGEVAGI